jgi:hypothetical protein
MLFVESKIKKILKQPDHDVPLRKLALELGCSLESTYDQNAKHFESIVVSRIREAARSQRESRVYWIAILAAIASVLSALAAWTAVASDSKKSQTQRLDLTVKTPVD